MRWLGGIAAIGSLATLAWACESPTSIAIVITTDVPCESLKDVTVAVTRPGGTEGPTRNTSQCVPGDRDGSIGTLVLVPGGANDGEVAVTVVGGVDVPAASCFAAAPTGVSGCMVARRELRFVPQQQIEVAVVLRRACVGIACPDQTTCVRGACGSDRIDDPSVCAARVCNEDDLRPSNGTAPSDGGGLTPADAGSDARAIVLPDGATTCKSDEKVCNERCVRADEPAFGCTAAGCGTCPGSDIAVLLCVQGACTVTGCQTGYKRCGESCVPADPAHSCLEPFCTSCASANGVATCDVAGKCSLACDGGFKLCGAKCVSANDPTYGCGPASCSNQSCPDPGAGTLVCSSGTCVIGTCPAQTKNCNQKCVPTDANNGCAAAGVCTCNAGDVCQGSPTVCTCVPEPASATCATKACGTALNNCGQPVACADTCELPFSCAGGGAGPNACGCQERPIAQLCGTFQCGAIRTNCNTIAQCPDKCPAQGCVCGTSMYVNFCGYPGTGAPCP